MNSTSITHARHSTVGFLKASQAGFDWFVATVFLITRGSLQTTLNTLQEISCLLTSAYLWPSRVHKSVMYLYMNTCNVIYVVKFAKVSDPYEPTQVTTYVIAIF